MRAGRREDTRLSAAPGPPARVLRRLLRETRQLPTGPATLTAGELGVLSGTCVGIQGEPAEHHRQAPAISQSHLGQDLTLVLTPERLLIYSIGDWLLLLSCPRDAVSLDWEEESRHLGLLILATGARITFQMQPHVYRPGCPCHQ